MTGRTALVTGANGGIGAAIAERLRADGLKVLTLDISGPCDIQLDIATDPMPAVLAEVDVCVSNAGIVDTVAPTHRMTGEQWRRDIDVNLTGAFRVIQACLVGMRERGWGRIVAISSLAGHDGLPGQVAYAASKAGLHGMMRTIATENAKRGITANCVLPGMVATPKALAMPDAVRDRILPLIPMGRFAEPAEIAGLVGYLAGESAGYLTAQEIEMHGGLGLNTMSLGGSR
ncbi:MAG TPA: SDR family NAD(P)-dependent oxidoreductase [Pseudonocardia sp.]|uniref:SDR family oxidoreductase n=1 Tax=Pseudonocardia sp. TaxID=60912 RepID=UPI002C7C01E9|nr:SDR family NAD(P)-dependent oxidoreductase [Pseudonocardia sp.]HTF47356.1 SDR family NAD(P)-dependent oxidoreductase [Pseudonocardia sp.]